MQQLSELAFLSPPTSMWPWSNPRPHCSSWSEALWKLGGDSTLQLLIEHSFCRSVAEKMVSACNKGHLSMRYRRVHKTIPRALPRIFLYRVIDLSLPWIVPIFVDAINS